MPKRRGRRTLWTTSLLALAVIALTTWALRGVFLEFWFVGKLDAEDEETRLEAADRLAGLRSLRAVPKLVDMIVDDEREMAVWDELVLRGFDGQGPDYALRLQGVTPLLHALYRIGPGVEPLVKSALQRRRKTADPRTRRRIDAVEGMYRDIRRQDPELTGDRISRLDYRKARPPQRKTTILRA